jgi:hypothetical protein
LVGVKVGVRVGVRLGVGEGTTEMVSLGAMGEIVDG